MVPTIPFSLEAFADLRAHAAIPSGQGTEHLIVGQCRPGLWS